MASKKSDYFGLSWIVSLILAIIPVTSWICGAITRFSEGKIVAGLIRLIFGFNIVWCCYKIGLQSKSKPIFYYP